MIVVTNPEDDPLRRAARRRHAIFLAVTAIVAVAVVVAAQAVILPFVLAVVIAYVLTPLVVWVEKKRVPRALAIIVVYVVVLGSLGVFVRLAAPRVGHELGAFRRELPTLVRTVQTEWVPALQSRLRAVGLGQEEAKPEATPPTAEPDPTKAAEQPPTMVVRQRADGSFGIELQAPILVTPTRNGGFTIDDSAPREPPSNAFDANKMIADAVGKSLVYAQHNTLEVFRIGRDIVAGVSRVFFVFGITLMLAAYMMLTRERILAFFESLVRPPSRAGYRDLLARIDRGLSGVVRGQLIICLVNGVLSAVGFAIVGLKYWPVLALIATVFSLIPIFGSIVSSIPAVALGLTQSPATAAFVLAWIIGIHQLEANLLNPKIMGDQARIHPVLVVFSLLVGEHFFQITGALLAVPCMSIAQSVFIHVRRWVQAQDPDMADEPVGSLRPPPDPAPREGPLA